MRASSFRVLFTCVLAAAVLFKLYLVEHPHHAPHDPRLHHHHNPLHHTTHELKAQEPLSKSAVAGGNTEVGEGDKEEDNDEDNDADQDANTDELQHSDQFGETSDASYEGKRSSLISAGTHGDQAGGSAPAVDKSADVDACPGGLPHKQTKNHCGHVWNGKLHSPPGAGDGGPYMALLPMVKTGAHAATLVELPSGDIVLAWFTGEEGQAGVSIAVSTLPAGGRQWSKPALVSEAKGRSNQNPVLFHDPGTAGTVHLLHTSQAANKGQGTARIVALNSTDGGRTWTPPTPHPSFAGAQGPFLRGQVLVGQDGREWLLPMYYTPPGAGIEGHYCAMWRSCDSGVSWGEEALMSEKGQFLAQPSVVRVASGALRAFYRDRKGLWVYTSDSRDDGRTWPKQPKRSKLPNNQSGIQALVLASGRLVIAFNNLHCDHKKRPPLCNRHPLSLALSEDEGASWRWVRDIEFGGKDDHVIPPRQPPRAHRYSYPTIIQTRDGLIHVAFSYRKKVIKHVVVDEEWIKHGRTRGVFRGEGPK